VAVAKLSTTGGRQSSPTLRRMRLGSELRRLREASGLTIHQVAEELYCSRSKVSRIETANVSATPRDVRDMLALYDVSAEQRDALLQLAQDAREKEPLWQTFKDIPDALKKFIDLEKAADAIYMGESLVIPGLLQIEDYARVVIHTLQPNIQPGDLENHVQLRLARQSLLTDSDPPLLWAIVDEAALHRLVGNRLVMRRQLGRLIEAMALPNVTFQIVPFSAGAHAGMIGPFTILQFPDPHDPAVVLLEQSVGDLYLKGTDEIERYRLLFKDLEAVALPSSDSAALLEELKKRL
jgi:transcriptional regulator with XRE-family HTH domain